MRAEDRRDRLAQALAAAEAKLEAARGAYLMARGWRKTVTLRKTKDKPQAYLWSDWEDGPDWDSENYESLTAERAVKAQRRDEQMRTRRLHRPREER